MASEFNDWADKVVDRGLEAPAIFLLEMHKPLVGMMNACLVYSAPLLKFILSAGSQEQLQRLLSSREQVEKFIQTIEERRVR